MFLRPYHMGFWNEIIPEEDQRVSFLSANPKISPFVGDAAITALKVDNQYFIQKIAIKAIKDISGHNLGDSADRAQEKENAQNESSIHSVKLTQGVPD